MSDFALANEQPGALVPVDAMKDQINAIQRLMSEVMIKADLNKKVDGHYGTIPGCGDKPVLLKAGAEKICSMFRIAVDPEVEDLSTGSEIRYRVKVRGISSSGVFLGAGIGECSSAEEKYAWRRAYDDDEWDNAPEHDRRKKPMRRGGAIPQVRTNPADQANTVLKMSKKRGLIDMVLTVTAASDIFTQDLDDESTASQARGGEEPKPKPEPRRKSERSSKTDGVQNEVTGVITELKEASGRDWTRLDVFVNDERYGIFINERSDDWVRTAEDAHASGDEVTIGYEVSGQYRNVTSIEVAHD